MALRINLLYWFLNGLTLSFIAFVVSNQRLILRAVPMAERIELSMWATGVTSKEYSQMASARRGISLNKALTIVGNLRAHRAL